MISMTFRGKNNHNEWHYGFYAGQYLGGLHAIISHDGKRRITTFIKPETVGIGTGLKDKTGKREIFTGDVCKKDSYLYEVVWVERQAKFGLKVITSNYVLTRGGTFPLHQYLKEDSLETTVEIIGNIHDNKDLLIV